MKDFLSRNGIWILLAAVIITVTMAALSAFGSGVATPLQNAVGVLSSPFRTGFSTVAGWVDDRIRFADDYDALVQVNGYQELPITVAAQRVLVGRGVSQDASRIIVEDLVRGLFGVAAAIGPLREARMPEHPRRKTCRGVGDGQADRLRPCAHHHRVGSAPHLRVGAELVEGRALFLG